MSWVVVVHSTGLMDRQLPWHFVSRIVIIGDVISEYTLNSGTPQ